MARIPDGFQPAWLRRLHTKPVRPLMSDQDRARELSERLNIPSHKAMELVWAERGASLTLGVPVHSPERQIKYERPRARNWVV